MGIASEKPEGILGRQKQKWDYVAPGKGETRTGYLAARPLWITVHHEHGSRPCRMRVSRGELSCPMCAVEAASSQRGYVPYYTPQYQSVFFVSPPSFRLSLDEIEPGSQIVIRRGKKVYDAAIATVETFRPIVLPTSLPVGDAVDLLPSLLRIWKDVALERWHCSTLPSDAPVSPPAPAVDVPQVIADRMAGNPVPAEEEAGRLLDGVLGRLSVKGKTLAESKPSANGKHKPPPKG